MDHAPPCPSRNLGQPPAPGAASQQDQTRPISTVAQLPHRSEEEEEDIPDHAPLPHYEHSLHSQHSHLDTHPPLSHHSSTHSARGNTSPLYQTVIPAFNPNHYDLHATTVCLCIPLTMKSPVNRWRARRRSVKDLRDREDELRREHAKLKELENRWRYRVDLPRYEWLPKDNPQVRDQGVEHPRSVGVPDPVRHPQMHVGVK